MPIFSSLSTLQSSPKAPDILGIEDFPYDEARMSGGSSYFSLTKLNTSLAPVTRKPYRGACLCLLHDYWRIPGPLITHSISLPPDPRAILPPL